MTNPRQILLDCPQCWKQLVYVHSVPNYGNWPRLDLYRCTQCDHTQTIKNYADKADDVAA